MQGNDVGIIKLQQYRMDRGYLEKWAAELKVADLLERCLREVGGWLETSL